MEFIKSSQTHFLPFREKCCQNFDRFSPVKLRDSIDGSNAGNRILENINNSFHRYSALNLSGRKKAHSKDTDSTDVDNSESSFIRNSPLNLSGRRDAKLKMQTMKNTLTKDIHNIREVITSISSPQGYKRKLTNIINEDRREFAVVDLTVNLCDTIEYDDDDEEVEVPILKKQKFSESD